MLDAIGMQQDDLRVVQAVLAWLVTAKRPLTLHELEVAVAVTVNPGGLYLLEDDAPYPEYDLQEICGPFIALNRSFTVELAHQSVKEYLTSKQLPDGSLNPYFIDVTEGQSSLLLDSCLTHFSFTALKWGSPYSSLVLPRIKSLEWEDDSIRPEMLDVQTASSRRSNSKTLIPIEQLQACVNADPENKALKKSLAMSLMATGKLDEAITCWSELAEREPNSFTIMEELYTTNQQNYSLRTQSSFVSHLRFIILCAFSILSRRFVDWGVGQVDWWPFASEDDLMMLEPHMAKVKYQYVFHRRFAANSKGRWPHI